MTCSEYSEYILFLSKIWITYAKKIILSLCPSIFWFRTSPFCLMVVLLSSWGKNKRRALKSYVFLLRDSQRVERLVCRFNETPWLEETKKIWEDNIHPIIFTFFLLLLRFRLFFLQWWQIFSDVPSFVYFFISQSLPLDRSPMSTGRAAIDCIVFSFVWVRKVGNMFLTFLAHLVINLPVCQQTFTTLLGFTAVLPATRLKIWPREWNGLPDWSRPPPQF